MLKGYLSKTGVGSQPDGLVSWDATENVKLFKAIRNYDQAQ
jgi:hypothetical protein